MKTFTIDDQNNITAFAAPQDITNGGSGDGQVFATAKELAKVARAWPATRTVEIWNSLPGVKPVNKFTDRKTSLVRIWKAIQNLEPAVAREAAPGETKSRKTADGGRERPRAKNQGSKKDQVIELLKQRKGASLSEIMSATSWQAHSVRGFISGSLGKKMGLKVNSFKRSNGERAYQIEAV